MNPAQNFILDLEGEQAELFQYLHDLFSTYPEVESKIRYRIPFYFRKSWICYLNPKAKGGVELCFLRASELSNEQGLLDTKGRTQVAGLMVYNINDIPMNTLMEVMEEALLLDEVVPYASKRKKK